MSRISSWSLNDKSLQLKFSKKRLCHFWISARNEWPVISDLAIYKLLAFCTTYVCEAELSRLIIIKSKNRSFLKSVEKVLRPALSCINLQRDDLCKNHQVLPSLSLRLITSINWIVYGQFCFAWKFLLRGSFITEQLLSSIVCICVIRHRPKCLLSFVMERLHVSLTTSYLSRGSRPVTSFWH